MGGGKKNFVNFVSIHQHWFNTFVCGFLDDLIFIEIGNHVILTHLGLLDYLFTNVLMMQGFQLQLMIWEITLQNMTTLVVDFIYDNEIMKMKLRVKIKNLRTC